MTRGIEDLSAYYRVPIGRHNAREGTPEGRGHGDFAGHFIRHDQRVNDPHIPMIQRAERKSLFTRYVLNNGPALFICYRSETLRNFWSKC